MCWNRKKKLANRTKANAQTRAAEFPSKKPGNLQIMAVGVMAGMGGIAAVIVIYAGMSMAFL